MSAEEIWEECICDSLGDMNIFAGKEAIGAFLDQMLPEISAVASESKSQLIIDIERRLNGDVNADTRTVDRWIKSFQSRKRLDNRYNDNAHGGRSTGTVDGVDGGTQRGETGGHSSEGNGNSRITEGKTSREVDTKYSSAEEAKASGKVSDAKFSIEFADDIANKQRKFVADGLSRISSEELEPAIADTAHMVNEMKPYANILPQDKVGQTLVKNGSYDVSVENTTVCIRTLAYNSFVDMVSEKVGRPLTQMESLLVSQKLYEIAKEPQCLYCYVSLDRKAFN